MRFAVPLACVVLAGCGLAPLPEAEPVDGDVDVEALGIQADGPIVEVASGDADGQSWTVVALRATDGDVCLVDVVDDMPIGGSCGGSALPRGLGYSLVGGEQRPLVSGRWSDDARGARIVTSVGVTEARVVSLARLGIEESAMAALLPAGAEPTAVEVLDGGGAVLERLELGPMP